MLYTLLIITLFLLASLLVCLLILRLSINIKHLCIFWNSVSHPFPPVYFDFPLLIKINKDLRSPPPPPPPFILTPYHTVFSRGGMSTMALIAQQYGSIFFCLFVCFNFHCNKISLFRITPCQFFVNVIFTSCDFCLKTVRHFSSCI